MTEKELNSKLMRMVPWVGESVDRMVTVRSWLKSKEARLFLREMRGEEAQVKWAKRMKVSTTYVSRVENGHIPASPKYYLRALEDHNDRRST